MSGSAAVRFEPTQPRSQQRRELMLDACAALLDSGTTFSALSTSDVAAHSGSAIGSVYRYFGDSGGVVDALAVRNCERAAAALRGLAASEPVSAGRAVSQINTALAQLLQSEPGFRIVGFGMPATAAALRNADRVGTAYVSAFERLAGVVPVATQRRLRIGMDAAFALLVAAFAQVQDGEPTYLRAADDIVVGFLDPASSQPVIATRAG
jgi:AcrR family transcriptional regulator